MRCWIYVLLGTALLVRPAVAADPFFVQIIEVAERTVVAEIADLDGDGRSDLLQVVFAGIPPNEKRLIRVFYQRAQGTIPGVPDLEVPLPGPAAAFDLANLRGDAGVELLLLTPKGVTIVSFDGLRAGQDPESRGIEIAELRVPGGLSVGAAEDERGLDRLPMVSLDFGEEPRLLVPGLGETFVLSAEGTLHARVRVGGRANYIIAPPGPVLAESDVQLFFDPSRVFVGDVDGDGLADIVGSTRHELRVFRGRPDGSYSLEPDEQIWLGLVSEADHIRGSGAVRTAVRDIDGDGLLDLLITKSSGSILDANATSSIYLNRAGKWKLDEPDGEVSIVEALSADQLLDVDADGRLELVQISFPMTVLELIEMFFSRSVDARFKVYALEEKNGKLRLGEKPRVIKKISIPLDFKTGRPHGFTPTLDFDFNGDGKRDYLSSTDGSALKIFLGGEKKPYARRDGEQSLETVGRVREGDLNGDGLTDMVLYNPRKPGSHVFLLRNAGVLPGTPKASPELRPAP